MTWQPDVTWPIWIALGALGGALHVGLVQWWSGNHPAPERAENKAWRVGLLWLAALYVPFALLGGGSAQDIGVELAGAAAYASLALLAKRHSPWWAALGWALHPLWDVLFNTQHAPHFFAPACLGWDPIVSGYIAFGLLRRRRAAPA